MLQGRVIAGRAGTICHPFPRPPASAGESVTTPANTLSSAPSAAITPSRLMAITPLDGQARGDLLLVAPPALHRAASVNLTHSTTITLLFAGYRLVF